MGFRFRKSFTILPGVRVNLGKSGLTSVSIGGKGVRLTMGKRGTTVTTSIPGTGLSYSHRIDGTKQSRATVAEPERTVTTSVSRPTYEQRIEDYPPYRALHAYVFATPHPRNKQRLGWWRRLLRQRPSAPALPEGAPPVPSGAWLAGRLLGFDLDVPEILVETVQGGRGAVVRLGYDRFMGTPFMWARNHADNVRDMWLRVVGYRAVGELFQAYPALKTLALTGYHNDRSRNFDPSLTDYSVLVTRAEWQASFWPATIAPALGDCLNSFGLRMRLAIGLPWSSPVPPYELGDGGTNVPTRG
jgi:hypothetical protein